MDKITPPTCEVPELPPITSQIEGPDLGFISTSALLAAGKDKDESTMDYIGRVALIGAAPVIAAAAFETATYAVNTLSGWLKGSSDSPNLHVF